MKLKGLERVNSSTSWDEEKIVGFFDKQLDDTDELSLSDNNLRNEDKKVVVFVHDDKDEAPLMVYCSKKLSAIVRKALKAGQTKAQVLGALIGLRLMKTEVWDSEGNPTGEEIHVLIPNAGELETFKVKALKKEKLTYEDLVAF